MARTAHTIVDDAVAHGSAGAIPTAFAREEAVGSTRQRSALTESIDDARFHEVALLVLHGTRSQADICERTGLSRSQLRRILVDHRDRFVEVYTTARTQFLGRLADIARDEREETLLRDAALASRARTLGAKLVDELEARINASATDKELAVGVKLYAAVLDRAGGGGGGATARNGSTTHINVFAPTIHQATVIKQSFVEAGVSMDDLLGEVFARGPVDVDAASPDPGFVAQYCNVPPPVVAGERDVLTPSPADPTSAPTSHADPGPFVTPATIAPSPSTTPPPPGCNSPASDRAVD